MPPVPPWTTATNHDRGPRSGFVLVEVILVLIASSIVVATLLTALIALMRSLQPRSVRLGEIDLPIAPTFAAFPSAVRLHQDFTDRLAQARAVYVFGGRDTTAVPDDTADRPLNAQALPTIDDFSPGLPVTAAGFYAQYAAALGPQESTATSDDFTIVIVGPVNDALAVTCLVQVRREDQTVSDGTSAEAFVLRRATLWQPGGGAAETYAFAQPTAQAKGTFVGAVHTWFRSGATSAEQEEGPACVAFPDPWLFAGARGQGDDVPAFSRFTYFLPISP